ncbi:MAG TPA: hypothetical protein VGU66_09030 [Candidatus Elarobacter sp.]|nr:hypothetical protein [Candidatus Elarobacter sp.]
MSTIRSDDLTRLAELAVETVSQVYDVKFETGTVDVLVRAATDYEPQLSSRIGENVVNPLMALAHIGLGQAIIISRLQKPSGPAIISAEAVRIQFRRSCPFYGLDCEQREKERS